VLAVLPAPAVQQANVDNLLYRPQAIIGLLSDEGSPERTQLTRAWGDALGRLGGGNSPLSTAEELLRIRARVMLAKLDAPAAPLPASLLEEARQAVARVDAATPAGHPRQAAINAAANLYWEAGLETEANTLLTAELEKSKSPYYFMLDLADLAEKAGRKDEAVAWLARAYDGAKGPATRFQWGHNYLMGLLEMTPEDTRGIERAGLSVLGELDAAPDAFYQRTRMRLEQLNSKLLEWGQSGEAAKVLETLRARTGEICRKLPEKDAGRASCENFLTPAAKSTHPA
jgi:protein disulfide-isomerase